LAKDPRPKSKDKPLFIQLAERDDFADFLRLIPSWIYGALFWVAISELFLKRLFPEQANALQAAIVGADVVSDMPPGVAMVATIYTTLAGVEASQDLFTWLKGVRDSLGAPFGIDPESFWFWK